MNNVCLNFFNIVHNFYDLGIGMHVITVKKHKMSSTLCIKWFCLPLYVLLFFPYITKTVRESKHLFEACVNCDMKRQ